MKLYRPEKDAVRHKGARDLSGLKEFIVSTLNSAPDNVPVHNDGLYELTSNDFEDHISKSHHFIMFYAPWCGHCKRLEPVWEDLAKYHEFTNDVKIGRVSVFIGLRLCQRVI